MPLATAHVRDAYVRKPYVVDGSTDLVSLCREMSRLGLTTALVRDGGAGPADDEARLGIFTTTDLRDALLRDVPPAALPVREVARFDLVEVQADAGLFEALVLMVRHRVHRLVVRDGRRLVGVLGQLDLVSFVAHHSHILGLQIDEADSVEALEGLARRVDEQVELLEAGGIGIVRLAELASALNRRLVARAWTLVAPPRLLAASCLLLLGSEGRGEQVLKTDQDNALILRDGADPALQDEARTACERLGAALAGFGWPPCPGGIMVTNPAWRQTLTGWRETLARWVHDGEPEGAMQLAIFCDAAVVAGDPTLLEALRGTLETLATDSDAFLARFAAAADQFAEPAAGWLSWLSATIGESIGRGGRGPRRDEALDLKKLGTFPIVHGARALALQHRVRATATAERLKRLADAGLLDPALARDLAEALALLMRLRIRGQLGARIEGRAPTNEIKPSELSTLEREALRDALGIVRAFRTWLRQHFRLDAL